MKVFGYLINILVISKINISAGIFNSFTNYRSISKYRSSSNPVGWDLSIVTGHSSSSLNNNQNIEILPKSNQLTETQYNNTLKLKGSNEKDLLDLIDQSNKGITMTDTDRIKVNLLFEELSDSSNEVNAIMDQNLYGLYNVSYVGTGKSQRGNPAGGSKLGSFLYKNEGLYQHILKDKVDPSVIVVLNYIKGTLFNIIPMAVILKGVANALSFEERMNLIKKFGTKLSFSTVQADFLPPRIIIGNPNRKFLGKFLGICISAGPPSSVVLDTPYLSDRVRLGLGARGSSFVFSKLDDSDPQALSWEAAYKIPPTNARKLGIFLFGIGSFIMSCSIINSFHSKMSILLNAGLSWSYKIKLLLAHLMTEKFNILAFPLLLFGYMLRKSKGGIEDDDDSREIREAKLG